MSKPTFLQFLCALVLKHWWRGGWRPTPNGARRECTVCHEKQYVDKNGSIRIEYRSPRKEMK